MCWKAVDWREAAHFPVRHLLELPVNCFLSFSLLLINIILYKQFMGTFFVSQSSHLHSVKGSCSQLIKVCERNEISQRQGKKKKKRGNLILLRNRRRLDRCFFSTLLFTHEKKKGWACWKTHKAIQRLEGKKTWTHLRLLWCSRGARMNSTGENSFRAVLFLKPAPLNTCNN